MPRFRYQAATAGTELVEGMLEAESKSAVVDRLHSHGQVPIRIEEVGTSPIARLLATEIFSSPGISSRALALLTGQLAMLLKAGLALDEALIILQDLVDKPAQKECLNALVEKISSGTSLADAMAAQKVFPGFYVSMVRAGEAGASLETVLERLADFLERSHVTREHIKSALLYPAIVAVVCCLSIAVLFLFVVPRFRPLFEQSGDALPTSARYLLSASDFLQDFWWVLVVGPLLLVMIARWQLKNAVIRQRWQRILLDTPFLGDLVRKVETARFSRTLGTLLKNGVSLLGALQITRETIGNAVFADAVERIIERAKTGKGLAEPLRQAKVFPALAIHLLRVGEESGRQDEMLLSIADIFESETRRTVDRLLALLAPAVTIVLGLIVAGVILSILSALLGVYDLTL
jgi:general secretion pathway protein F